MKKKKRNLQEKEGKMGQNRKKSYNVLRFHFH